MKVLRVCNSADLPVETSRDDNYVYFTYDNMEIYIGRNRYYDHYCIVDVMPERPASHMLYITMEGDMKTYVDNNIIDLGSIEDPSQTQYLLQAGSTFFMKAEYRYLDLQTRTIQLPYQNGTYMLSTSAAQEIMIDNDTVISYDESKGHFVIDGNLNNTEELKRISEYKAYETSTAKTNINGLKAITTDVKVSENYYNLIKITGDGIFASMEGLATSDEVHMLANTYYNFKKEMLWYIAEIQAGLEGIDSISEEALSLKILSALEAYHPTVQSIIDNYEIMYNQLGILTQTIEDYADEKFDEIYQEVLDYLLDLEIKWEAFNPEGEPDSPPESAYTEAEIEVRNMILEAYNKQLVVLRKHAEDENISVLYSIITDESHFNGITTNLHGINTLNITSTPGSAYKYTKLTVDPEKSNELNRYFYAVDLEHYPIANQKVDLTVYTEWNGEDELEIEYGKSIIVIEANVFRRTIRYGIVESRANRG